MALRPLAMWISLDGVWTFRRFCSNNQGSQCSLEENGRVAGFSSEISR